MPGQGSLFAPSGAPAPQHKGLDSRQGKCGTKRLVRSTKDPSKRRWMCMGRRGQEFEIDPPAAQLLHEIKGPGKTHITKRRAEHKSIQRMAYEGLVKLQANPRHYNYEFEVSITRKGRNALQARESKHQARAQKQQARLFKGGRLVINGSLLGGLLWGMSKAEQLGMFTSSRKVKQHARKKPKGGVSLVKQHTRERQETTTMIAALKGYRPGTKPFAALKRLAKDLRVHRADCTVLEKAGFTLLEKRGVVEKIRGEYRPKLRTIEDEAAYWAFLERWGIVEQEATTKTDPELPPSAPGKKRGPTPQVHTSEKYIQEPDRPSAERMAQVATYQDGGVSGHIKAATMPRTGGPAMMVLALDVESGSPLVNRTWLPNATEASARKWLAAKLGPEDESSTVASTRNQEPPERRVTLNATHTSLIEAIATKADRKAATAARRGKPNKGLFASFGKLDQRAFGIEYPNTVTATHRAKMIAVLRSRGYTVSEHTSTDRKGNEKFLSLKVVAEAL